MNVYEPYQKELEQKLKSIDFVAKRKKIIIELEGEFDYEGFMDEIDNLKMEFTQTKKDFNFECSKFFIIIPHNVIIDEKEFNDLGS